MAKCPEELKQYILGNKFWFEKLVVASCRKDMDLFRRLSIVLCLQPGSKKEHTDDFEDVNHNVIYAAIRDYNNIFLDSKVDQFVPLTEDWLHAWLVGKGEKAEIVSLSEVPGVMQYFRDHILNADVSSNSIFLVKTGISEYLRSVRARKIVTRVTLTGANLDDLALLCEGDMELIDNLEDSNRVTSDIPDRIAFNDIPIFADPNKALVETLDCDIPALNEALGSFRKKSAYMFIGGTGSGKTIAACQLCCAFSFSGNANGLYVSTEQSFEQLYTRIVSNRCSIPHKVISKGIMEASLSPREKEALLDFRAKCNSLATGTIHYANWGNFEKTPGFSVARALEKEMELFEAATGKKLDYIILDWIGGCLGTMVGQADKARHVYQEAADSLETLARKHSIVSIAFAQAVPGSTNKLQIESQDLQECKTMSRNYAGVIGITALYSEEYARQKAEENNKKRKDFRISTDIDEGVAFNTKQFFHVSKARYGIQRSVPFRREYEFQRMSPWV